MSNRDKTKFEQAAAKWQELHEARCYSVSPGIGRTAIVCSYLTDYESTGSPTNMAEVVSFLQEAQDIKAQIAIAGREAVIFEDASGETLTEVLQDETISDVVTIGHGALPYLYIANGTKELSSRRFTELTALDGDPINNRFDWWDASKAATHLKLGMFVQRHCGNAVRDLSVPMGLFTMADHSSVYAPINAIFMPKSLMDRDENEKIQSVSEEYFLSYGAIKEMYPRPWGDELEEALAEGMDAPRAAMELLPSNILGRFVSNCSVVFSHIAQI